jgi:hypothetical protein
MFLAPIASYENTSEDRQQCERGEVRGEANYRHRIPEVRCLTTFLTTDMRRLPRAFRRNSVSQFRFFTTSHYLHQTSAPNPPPPQLKPTRILSEKTLETLHSPPPSERHPQTPLPTRGFGPFTRNAETGQRLTFREREEERAKEYLYEQPDPNQPLPPLLLRPPGLREPPVPGIGHGTETRKWWQREFEIWFGRYQKPFDVQAQLARHRKLYSKSN